MIEETREGTVVDDRFELRERIDDGGFASVWRGIDLNTGRPVAVKCERSGVHERAQVRAHFHQELHWFRRFASGPTPSSLVHFVDGSIGSDGGYVVTEFIDGVSIDSYLAGDAAPDIDAFRAVGEPVCRALEFLHTNGVLHLDLKPGNVLFRQRGPPVVIDLNSAVQADEGTDMLFEHDPFKPPELTPTDLRDERVGPWSDVYALGKLFVFLLTGESVPFTTSALDEWEAVDPRSYGAGCSSELAAVLQQATEPHPRDRFDDAGGLYTSLVPFFDTLDRSALLVHEQSSQRCPVRPGDTLGRWTPDRQLPTIVLPDVEQFLSPNHATFELTGTDWLLRDRSVNGTYVRTSSDWRYVLSRNGYERRREAGAPVHDSASGESIRLTHGARIAPVSPRFGSPLSFMID